jgi:hypothetical protein
MAKVKTYGFEITYGNGAHPRIIDMDGTNEKTVKKLVRAAAIRNGLFNPATDRFEALGPQVVREQNP